VGAAQADSHDSSANVAGNEVVAQVPVDAAASTCGTSVTVAGDSSADCAGDSTGGSATAAQAPSPAAGSAAAAAGGSAQRLAVQDPATVAGVASGMRSAPVSSGWSAPAAPAALAAPASAGAVTVAASIVPSVGGLARTGASVALSLLVGLALLGLGALTMRRTDGGPSLA
jgi:hypothetical protein